MTTSLASLDGKPTELSDDSLSELRTQLRGEALTPSDPGYEDARVPFNAMHADRPSLIARCTGTADVVDAVNFARENGIEVTVRGGGHSIAGFSSSDGGMVIDLSLMRGVDVDPEARVARVQGGALWGDADRETQAFGLAAPGGVVSETGVSGLTLGGGYGWLRRKCGLSCDNVVAAQVVCADGQVRTASADVNPDLFWGIRGGGGNFGIVTSFSSGSTPLGPSWRSPGCSTRPRTPPPFCSGTASTSTALPTRCPPKRSRSPCPRIHTFPSPFTTKSASWSRPCSPATWMRGWMSSSRFASSAHRWPTSLSRCPSRWCSPRSTVSSRTGSPRATGSRSIFRSCRTRLST
jgi:hypothetical protein